MLLSQYHKKKKVASYIITKLEVLILMDNFTSFHIAL